MLLAFPVFEYDIGQGGAGGSVALVAELLQELLLVGLVMAELVEACQVFLGERTLADVVFDDSPGDLFAEGGGAELFLQEGELGFGFRGALLEVFDDVEFAAVEERPIGHVQGLGDGGQMGGDGGGHLAVEQSVGEVQTFDVRPGGEVIGSGFAGVFPEDDVLGFARKQGEVGGDVRLGGRVAPEGAAFGERPFAECL